MLIYILLMTAIALYLYRESKKLSQGRSSLLRDYCKDPAATKAILSLLRKVCLAAAASAAAMLLCLIVSQATGVLCKPLAALSILLYTLGFIGAMFKLKNL